MVDILVNKEDTVFCDVWILVEENMVIKLHNNYKQLIKTNT